MPLNTFAATVAAVLKVGAHPVPSGLDPRDLGMAAWDVLDAVDGVGARAVVAVHLGGFIPHDFDLLLAGCRARGVAVIEDCAHALGAELGAVGSAGSRGDAGCFSFYPTKILTAGVGGILTTNHVRIAEGARRLRHHGGAANGGLAGVVGDDWLMSEITAGGARAQLRRLDDFLGRRRAVAAAYDVALANDARIEPIPRAPGTRSSFYKYPVLLRSADRGKVQRRLADRGIETGVLYDPPWTGHPAFQATLREAKAGGWWRGFGSWTDHGTLCRQLCLPMHAAVEVGDVPEIVGLLREAMAP